MIPVTAKFDPDPRDPRIVAVLAAREALHAAFGAQKAALVECHITDDIIVNAPHGAVIEKAEIMARFRAGEMRYEAGLATRIEHVAVRGCAVVVMGEETVHPIPGAPTAQPIVRRRVTDVWREECGRWRLMLRQATVISAV